MGQLLLNIDGHSGDGSFYREHMIQNFCIGSITDLIARPEWRPVYTREIVPALIIADMADNLHFSG